jgi:hypothetical protein
VAGWTFYFVGLDAFLQAAYTGESWSYFNEYAARWRGRQANPSYDAFFRRAQTLLFRFGLLGTVSVVGSVLLYAAKPREISTFLSKKTSPFNLSLFRIAVFGMLLSFHLESVYWYAQLPAGLQSPPSGMSWVMPLLSTDPTLVSVLAIVFQAACVFGLLGLYTPVATTVALVTGLYVLGIPQFYGKVSHFHYVFWCAALLIPSRSADVLSLDVLRRPSSAVASPKPARDYALPIRYAWLLLGIVYFFPGFWKFASEGFAWALSENVKHNMHMNWFLRSFEPFFRLDRYPLLYQGAGLFTLAFEMGFVFTLPFRSLRPWVLGAAFAFHEANRLFLGIFFAVLYPFLPFLIDLRSVIVRVGEWVSSGRVVLTYEEDEPWQGYVAGTLLRMDLFDRLRARAAGEEEEQETGRRLAVSASEADGEGLWVDGRPQWRRLLSLVPSVPFALPLLPLVPFAGRKNEAAEKHLGRRGTAAVSVVGGVLIAANVLFGFAKINSYPFSVYPTFAVRADSTVTTLRVEGIDEAGRSMKVLAGSQDHKQAGFSPGRFRGLIRSILRNRDDRERTRKLRALWSVVRQRRPDLKAVRTVRFYEAVYATNPDRTTDPLLDRSLLATLEVQAETATTNP